MSTIPLPVLQPRSQPAAPALALRFDGPWLSTPPAPPPPPAELPARTPGPLSRDVQDALFRDFLRADAHLPEIAGNNRISVARFLDWLNSEETTGLLDQLEAAAERQERLITRFARIRAVRSLDQHLDAHADDERNQPLADNLASINARRHTRESARRAASQILRHRPMAIQPTHPPTTKAPQSPPDDKAPPSALPPTRPSSTRPAPPRASPPRIPAPEGPPPVATGGASLRAQPVEPRPLISPGPGGADEQPANALPRRPAPAANSA